MAVIATGPSRRYCGRSHRQRAYEARSAGEQIGLAPHAGGVSARLLGGLRDGLQVLSAALTDVEGDLRRDPGHAEALAHLMGAARGPSDVAIEPPVIVEE